MNPEIIGFLAAFFTTVAYIPQALKVFRDRETRSISLGMYVTISIGIGLWFAYGVMIGSPSVMICNGITFLLAVTILIMKIRHG
jgi:MtN3 and saliva related transmembrane protein